MKAHPTHERVAYPAPIPSRPVTRNAGPILRISLLVAGLIAGHAAALAAGNGSAEFPRTEDYDYAAPAPGSYKLPVVKAAADGTVLDSKGQRLRLRDLTRGRVTVMSFIYTRCAAAKACPYATGVLAELHRVSAEDPALAGKLRLISMSFDSEGDRPEQMAAYSALADVHKGGAEWRFLTTPSRADLRPILQAYGQAVDKRANPADPEGPLYHTLRVFLIDREGRIRNIYSAGTLDPRLVLADIRTLTLEPGAGKP
jgi:protein SCO1